MKLTLGVAAHVDAGKTTLCEQMLRHTGVRNVVDLHGTSPGFL